jgi:hypothetical protein
MTTEARLAFVLFFFAVWCLLGLITWAIAAVVARGRGALPALPLALAASSAFGVAVPLLGARDFAGFLLSLLTAAIGGMFGSAGGIALAWRVWPASERSTDARSWRRVRVPADHGEGDGETD